MLYDYTLPNGRTVAVNKVTVDEDGHTDIPYTQVPNEIVRDKRFRATEKAVYLVLRSHAGDKYWCWLSVNTILKEAGMSVNTYYEALDALKDAGLVVQFDHPEHQSKAFLTTNIIRPGWVHPPKRMREEQTKEKARNLARFNAKKKAERAAFNAELEGDDFHFRNGMVQKSSPIFPLPKSGYSPLRNGGILTSENEE